MKLYGLVQSLTWVKTQGPRLGLRPGSRHVPRAGSLQQQQQQQRETKHEQPKKRSLLELLKTFSQHVEMLECSKAQVQEVAMYLGRRGWSNKSNGHGSTVAVGILWFMVISLYLVVVVVVVMLSLLLLLSLVLVVLFLL